MEKKIKGAERELMREERRMDHRGFGSNYETQCSEANDQ
jgi:hypothetical protein